MTNLEPINLDAIDARAAKATPGPWATQRNAGHLVYGDPRRGMFICDTGHVQQSLIDAEFIAAARTDVPALVDEVVRLRAIVETVRAETLIEAADEVHREARWQYERQLRTVRPVSLDPIPRLTMIERILRERAAALSPSTPLVEPSGVGE